MDGTRSESDAGHRDPRHPTRVKEEAPLTPEIVDVFSHAPDEGRPEPGGVFGSRAFGGGRFRVYGCSPGCLMLSLGVSIVASILLTLLLNLVF